MIRKILTYVMIISLLLCGCSYQQEVQTEKSYREYSAIFKHYGLDGMDDELVNSLEQRYSELPSEIEFNKAAD